MDLKITASVATLVLLLACTAPTFAKLPKVTVLASGVSHAQFVILGDVAVISPSPQLSKASARLAETELGCAPLSGLTRMFTRGEITLKLRQAGIDPATVDLEGAENVIVATSDLAANAIATAAATTVTLTPAGAAQPQPAHATMVIKPGDPVDVVLVDGPVTVHASAFASTGGGVGDHIEIRREGVSHPLSATIIGAGQVELEE